jgi:hypothetical protein
MNDILNKIYLITNYLNKIIEIIDMLVFLKSNENVPQILVNMTI